MLLRYQGEKLLVIVSGVVHLGKFRRRQDFNRDAVGVDNAIQSINEDHLNPTEEIDYVRRHNQMEVYRSALFVLRPDDTKLREVRVCASNIPSGMWTAGCRVRFKLCKEVVMHCNILNCPRNNCAKSNKCADMLTYKIYVSMSSEYDCSKQAYCAC